jgi:hypothetical protein
VKRKRKERKRKKILSKLADSSIPIHNDHVPNNSGQKEKRKNIMSRTADHFKGLPSLKSSLSKNERETLVSVASGAYAKLYPLLRSIVADSSDLPEKPNLSDLGAVRATCDRLFAILALDEKTRRDERRGGLKASVFSDAAVTAIVKGQIAARDALLAVPENVREAGGIKVPETASVPFSVVYAAVVTAYKGTTKEDTIRDMKAIGVETGAMPGTRGGGEVCFVPFALFESFVKEQAEKAAATNGTTKAEKPAKQMTVSAS